MRKRNLVWLWVGILLLFVGLSVVCFAEPVTIKHVVWTDDLISTKAVAAEFEKKNPGIKVDVIEYPDKDYEAKLAVQLAGGANIDAFSTKNNAQYSDLASKGQMVELSGLIRKGKVDVTGYGALYEGIKIKGKVYGLPFRRTTWVLFYNKTLFDQAKVPYPKADMTWTEFRELAKKMTNGSGPDKIWGANFHTWPTSSYLSGLQTGATFLDKNIKSFIAPLQLRLDLQKDGSIMDYHSQIATNHHYNTAFQRGNIAMNVIGDFHIRQLRLAEEKLNFDWDIVPLPHPDKVSSNTSVGMPTCVHVSLHTKHKNEAWKFVSFLTGPEGSKIFASYGVLPGYFNPENKKTYIGEGTVKPANLGIIFDQKVYVEYPAVPGITIAYTIFKEEAGLCFAGEQTPVETIAKMKKRIIAEINQ